jgi:two-component system sensor histidine kinase RegB
LLRSFVAASGLVGFLFSQALSNLQEPVTLIISIVLAIFTSVAFRIWRLRAASVISNAEIFGHLLFDVFFLVLLLLNTGGASNPLISYLLVLLAVTATLLPKPYVNSFAISGITIYTFFIFLDFQVEHQQDMDTAGQEMSFQLHLVGM